MLSTNAMCMDAVLAMQGMQNTREAPLVTLQVV